MNRKFKVFAVLFCAAVATVMTGCGNQGEPVVKITSAKGQVTTRQGSAESFATAAPEQQLRSGDAIKTGDESNAELELINDKSQIRLSNNTFLEIQNFTEKQLKQMSGIAIYKISPQNRALKIQTPQGMATVLGTRLRIDATENETVVSVEEGKVGFSKKAGHQVVIDGGMKYSTTFTDDTAKPIDPFELEKTFNGEDLKPVINPR